MDKKPSYEELEKLIQKHRQTEKTLRESDKFLHKIFDSIQDGISVLDTELNVIKTNHRMEQLYTNQMPLAGKKCYQVYQGRNSPCQRCPTLESIETGDIHNEIVPYPSEQNPTGWIELFSFPVKDEKGLVKNVIEYVKDITERKKAEDELLESEDKFRSLVEITSDWIWEVDQNGIYTYVSPKVKTLLGYEPQDLLGKATPFDFMPTEEAERVRRLFKTITVTREPLEGIENINIHRDGHTVVLETSGVPIFNKTGELSGYRGIDRDITERKQVEEQAKEFESRLVLQIERMPIGLIFWDKDFRVKSWNPAAEKIFGFTAEEMQGKHPYGRIVPKEAQPHVDDIWCRLLEGDMTAYSINENITKDGSIIICDWSNTPLKEADGSVMGALSMVQDITERKKAEEKLKESEKFSTSLLEQSPNAIIVYNPDTSVKYVNPSFEKLTGYTFKEVIGAKAPYPWWGNDKEYGTAKERVKLGRERIYLLERRYLKKSGDYFWVDLIVTPVFSNDELKYSFSTLIDISDRKKTELEKRELEQKLIQAQKMESIGTLAGGIAHDFNNILSPILLHSEMIMDSLPSNDPLKHDINEIYNAGMRARDLVKQILTFARKRIEEITAVKSSPIVMEAVKFLRSTIPTTIDIQYENRTEHDTVLADSTQLSQVVMNLCTNAAYAMKEKGGLLEIIIENEEFSENKAKRYINLKPGRYFKLSVKDNGTGIDPKIIDKIFDPYFTTKDVGEGTGFGLAVSHSIVQGYGGDIIVESSFGNGSTFIVYLPVEITGKQALKEESVKIPLGNETILFVDDEQSIVDITRKYLEKLGYKVTGRTSSVKALEAFRNNPNKYDLVITDMTMPNMTGEDLSRELLKIRPDLTVILCTGFSDKINEERAKKIGISAFFMKPIIMSEIARTIREVLDKAEHSNQ